MWNFWRARTLKQLLEAQLRDTHMSLLVATATRERAESEEFLYLKREQRIQDHIDCLTEEEGSPQASAAVVHPFVLHGEWPPIEPVGPDLFRAAGPA